MPGSFKFKDKKTGKVYDMPWEGDKNPTPYELAKFADDADNPDWQTKATSLARTAVSGLGGIGDKASRYWEGIKDVPKSLYHAADTAGKEGLAHIKAGEYPAALHSLTGFITDPFTPATPLLQPKMSQEEAKKEAVGQVAGLAGLPGNEFLEAWKKGDYSRLAGQATGAGLTLLAPHALGRRPVVEGLRTGPKPVVEDITGHRPIVETPYGGAGSRGLGTGSVVEGPQSVLPPERGLPAYGETAPPPPRELPPIGNQSPLPSVSDRGLPPAGGSTPSTGPSGTTYYGGPTGPVSPNINEPPTRTFRGGPGLASPGRMPVRNWSDAMARTGEFKSNQPLTEVPGPTRDVLPQTSPYRKGLQGLSELPVLEGEVVPPPPEAPPPIPPVSPEITPPVKGQAPTVEAQIAANEAKIKALQDRIKAGDRPKPVVPPPEVAPPPMDITGPPTEPVNLEPAIDRTPIPQEGESHQQFQRRTGLGSAEAARIYNKAKAPKIAPRPQPGEPTGPRPHSGLSDAELTPLVKARDPEAVLEAARRPTMAKVAGDIIKKAGKKPVKIDPFDTEKAAGKRTEVENDWRQEMLADGHPPEAVDAAIEAARKHKVDLSDVWTFSDLNQKIGALSDTAPVKGKRGGKIFSSLGGQIEKLKAEMARLKGEQGSIGPDVKAGMEARRARLGLDKPEIPDLPDITPDTEFDAAREASKAKAKRMVEEMTRDFGDLTSAGLEPSEQAQAKKALAAKKYVETMGEQKFAEERRTPIPDVDEAMGLENIKNMAGVHELSQDLPEMQEMNRRRRKEMGIKPDISSRSTAAKMSRRQLLASQNVGALSPEGPPRKFGLGSKIKKEFGRFFSDETGAVGPGADKLVKERRATRKAKAYAEEQRKLRVEQQKKGPFEYDLEEWKAEQKEMGFDDHEINEAIKETTKDGVDPTRSDDLYDLEHHHGSVSDPDYGNPEPAHRQKGLKDWHSKTYGETGPPSDMFERQKPELDSAAHSFSHEGFLGDLRESLGSAGRKLRKDLKGEKGFWKPFDAETKANPKKEAKAAAKDWIRFRQAAIEHGNNARDAVAESPAKAQEIVDKVKDTLKTMGIKAPKLKGMSPEEVGRFVLEAKVKTANIRFNDWLKESGYMGKGGQIDTSTPIGKNLAKWKANHLMPAKEWSSHLGGLAGWTKNIYLAGGIPGTPINIHGGNIARSDIAARGFLKGTKSALEGVFRPSVDKAVLKQYKHLIPEAIESGFQWHGIESEVGQSLGTSSKASASKTGVVTSGHSPELVQKLAAKGGTLGKAGLKGLEYAQGKLENPLFQRYLPARKLKFLAEKVAELEKRGMSRREAMTQASTMANDFYGGVEKVLRDRTGQNVLKAIALAPDWFESRIRLAGKQLKSVAGLEDKTYAKALARSTAMRLTKQAAIILGGKAAVEALKKEKPGEATNIPLGEVAGGRRASIPTLGTSNELLRLGEEGLLKSYKEGNPGVAFEMLKNRMSQPAQSAVQLLYGQDEFGNPIRGKSKFGKKIKFGKSAYEHLKIGTRPFQPQGGQALFDYLEGNIGGPEAIAKGLELPIEFRSKKTFGRRGQ